MTLKLLLVFAGICTYGVGAKSQNIFLRQEWRQPLTDPSEAWEMKIPEDLSQSRGYLVAMQTALFDRWLSDSTKCSEGVTKKNALYLHYFAEGQKKDYVHYLGKRQSAMQLYANGVWQRNKKGTLYGFGSYSRRHVHDLLFNYAFYPLAYAPYFVSDETVTAQHEEEIYNLHGAYSHAFRHWNIGVDVTYEGAAVAKVVNPRYSNYSYFFQPAISVAYSNGKRSWMGRLYPEFQQQSIAATTQKISNRYYLFYGFGQWDHRASQRAEAYSRQQSFVGTAAQLTYLQDGNCPYALHFSGHWRHISTEESNYKNLFEMSQQDFNQTFVWQRPMKSNLLAFHFSASETFQQGQQNIYEAVPQQKGQHLYDEEKVAQNDDYRHTIVRTSAQFQYDSHLSQRQRIAVQWGTCYHYDLTRYTAKKWKIAYATLTPFTKFSYSCQLRKYHLGIEMGGSWRFPMKKNLQFILVPDHFQRVMVIQPYQWFSSQQSQYQWRWTIGKDLHRSQQILLHGSIQLATSDLEKGWWLDGGVSFLF